ncbi:MAG: lytic transglycosylase domain-containing protein [Pseudomonadota bacterium]
MVAALSAVSATAEVERLQPDFSFKRVGVPSAGSSGRITVQIDPNAPPLDPVYADPEPTPAAIATPDLPEAPTPFSWFWNAVGTTIAEQSPGRLELAINAINSAPVDARVAAPRLQALQDLAAAHGREILKHTITNDVSPALVLAVISVESAGRVEAVSTAGAEGLMQLMPATAARFDVDDSMDPAQNIRGGVTYLGWLLDRFGNDPALALAGYNAGEGNVQRYEGVPPFAETRAYVPKVLAAWQVAKGLCTTPPELITDPCVFKVNGI